MLKAFKKKINVKKEGKNKIYKNKCDLYRVTFVASQPTSQRYCERC